MPEPHAKLLVVDDDEDIRTLLTDYLEGENFRVAAAASGTDLDAVLEQQSIDLIILDLMLPGEDGLSICRRLRATSTIPIIILTAKGAEIDRIVGLEMGADDYVQKPFNPRELVARIKAVLWRASQAAQPATGEKDHGVLGFEGFVLDTSTRELTDPDGNYVKLTSTEYDLLVAFTTNPKRHLSRDDLFKMIQGKPGDSSDRSMDMLVARLRKKIELTPETTHRIIKTVRGVGYTFTSTVTRQ